jgi:hypothetical protein
MNALITNIAAERTRDLREYADSRRLAGHDRRTPANRSLLERISIRRLEPGDRPALARVAERDSGDPPSGDALGAELDGRLIAAVSIASGASVADPFTRTAEAVEMLKLRAAQLRDADASRNRGDHQHHSLRGLSIRARRG